MLKGEPFLICHGMFRHSCRIFRPILGCKVQGHILDWVMYRSEEGSILQWHPFPRPWLLTTAAWPVTWMLPLLSIFRVQRSMQSVLSGKICLVWTTNCQLSATIAYFSDLLTVYNPFRQLCSSAHTQILHILPMLEQTFWPTLFHLLCSKAAEFDPSHPVLPCLQNCITNSLLQTIPQ